MKKKRKRFRNFEKKTNFHGLCIRTFPTFPLVSLAADGQSNDIALDIHTIKAKWELWISDSETEAGNQQVESLSLWKFVIGHFHFPLFSHVEKYIFNFSRIFSIYLWLLFIFKHSSHPHDFQCTNEKSRVIQQVQVENVAKFSHFSHRTRIFQFKIFTLFSHFHLIWVKSNVHLRWARFDRVTFIHSFFLKIFKKSFLTGKFIRFSHVQGVFRAQISFQFISLLLESPQGFFSSSLCTRFKLN